MLVHIIREAGNHRACPQDRDKNSKYAAYDFHSYCLDKEQFHPPKLGRKRNSRQKERILCQNKITLKPDLPYRRLNMKPEHNYYTLYVNISVGIFTLTKFLIMKYLWGLSPSGSLLPQITTLKSYYSTTIKSNK